MEIISELNINENVMKLGNSPTCAAGITNVYHLE